MHYLPTWFQHRIVQCRKVFIIVHNHPWMVWSWVVKKNYTRAIWLFKGTQTKINKRTKRYFSVEIHVLNYEVICWPLWLLRPFNTNLTYFYFMVKWPSFVLNEKLTANASRCLIPYSTLLLLPSENTHHREK